VSRCYIFTTIGREEGRGRKNEERKGTRKGEETKKGTLPVKTIMKAK